MWDALGYPLSVCALFPLLVVLPIAIFVRFGFWYDRWATQHGIQAPDDDDDDDSPFDSWWQAPPSGFHP